MNVLILDDDCDRHKQFDTVAPGSWRAHSAERAIAILDAQPRFDVAMLDHDLGSLDSNGLTVAEHIAAMPEEKRPSRVIVHSWNRDGAVRMAQRLQSAGVWVRWSPFGPTPLGMLRALVEAE